MTTHQAVDDLAYEEELALHPYSVRTWLAYAHAKANAPPAERYTVYERALERVPMSYKIWLRYLDELADDVSDFPVHHARVEAVNAVFERAFVFMHKMPRVWLRYTSFLAWQRKITRTRRVYDRALQSLPITQHHLVWPAYLEFVKACGVVDTSLRVYRRYIKLHPESTEEYIDHLIDVNRLDAAAQKLAEVLNDEKFVSKSGATRHQLWIKLCDLMSTNPRAVQSLRVDAIIRRGLQSFTNEVGHLWTALADYYIRSGHFEKARAVYEEAIEKVMTLRDFSTVFDAYTTFEEQHVSIRMNDDGSAGGGGGSAAAKDGDQRAPGVDSIFLEQAGDTDLLLERLEHLMDRRKLMTNSVLLRQNPHNVKEWLNRVKLYGDDADMVVKTYTKALELVHPRKAGKGEAPALWLGFARFYEHAGDLDSARTIFEKAVLAPFKEVDELADVWCAYAELELRAKRPKRALKHIKRALATAPKTYRRVRPTIPVQKRVWRSTRLWSLYIDLEEALGTRATTKAVYDAVLELKVATPQLVINFAHFLQQGRYFEEAFQAYEKGVSIFAFPYSYDIWVEYLTKFVARYGGSKLERARDLFEQAVESCTSKFAKELYLMYARLEEKHGLARRAMTVYDRACRAVPDNEKLDMYTLYVDRASKFFGVTRTREIYEQAIEALPDAYVKEMCVKFSDMEKKLGEIDRARAILVHASQFCDPRVTASFWAHWRSFEEHHGNEETFREMLRIKRSVEAQYAQVNFMFTSAAEQTGGGGGGGAGGGAKKRTHDAMTQLEQEVDINPQHREMAEAIAKLREGEDGATAGEDAGEPGAKRARMAAPGAEGISFVSSHQLAREQVAQAQGTNPEEIDLDDDSDDDDDGGDGAAAAAVAVVTKKKKGQGGGGALELEQQSVPAAVFGDAIKVAEKEREARGSGGGGDSTADAMGALERLRRKRK